MYNNAILVLLYNKEISESNTLSTLISSEYQFCNAKLVIWNNGPKNLKCYDVSFLTELGYEVQIKETLNNESLAVIYNSFIEEIQAEKYVFLDDDSKLNSSYLKAAANSSPSVVSMPKIISGGKVEHPRVNSNIYNDEVNFRPNDNVITIGSGLVVGKKVLIELLEYYSTAFDERFYLYGVDTTFCLRLAQSNQIMNIRIIDGFEHSLSRLENENEFITSLRRKERSYDIALSCRYYKPMLLGLFFLTRSILIAMKDYMLSRKVQVYIYHLIKGFLTGRHYRQP